LIRPPLAGFDSTADIGSTRASISARSGVRGAPSPAVADLEEIGQFISKDNPPAAEKVGSKIIREAESVAAFPPSDLPLRSRRLYITPPRTSENVGSRATDL
jgi:ParE toxin of type II toxin-antitoxin system, parDE